MLQVTGQARGPPSPHTLQHLSPSWSFVPARFFLPGLIKAQTRDQRRDVSCHHSPVLILSPAVLQEASHAWKVTGCPPCFCRGLRVLPGHRDTRGAMNKESESTKQLEKSMVRCEYDLQRGGGTAFFPTSSLPKTPSLPHHVVLDKKKFLFTTKLCCRSSASHRMWGQHRPGPHLVIAALLCVRLEGTGTALSSGLQQGHAGLLWKICTLIFCSSKAEVVGMKENSLWSSYLESMNSWAFYSSGMPGTRVWFYKASKPQLKVWMNINHSGTMTAARVFTPLSGGTALRTLCSVFPTCFGLQRRGLLPSG